LRHGTTLRPPRRAVADYPDIAADVHTASRWQGTSSAQGSRRSRWHLVDASHRGQMARSARAISVIPNLPSPLPGVGSFRCFANHLGSACPRPGETRQIQSLGVLHRRDLCGGEKGGSGVGKTKRGKGTKLMAVANGDSLPVAIHATSASPHEVTLVDDTLAQRHTKAAPQKLIGDLAYDSDGLDRGLARKRIELIAPHRSNRRKPATQDGRPLRRYRRRWKVERLFAWLQNYRRILTRHEYHLENYLGFVQLGCILILLNNGF
jgi:transposase